MFIQYSMTISAATSHTVTLPVGTPRRPPSPASPLSAVWLRQTSPAGIYLRLSVVLQASCRQTLAVLTLGLTAVGVAATAGSHDTMLSTAGLVALACVCAVVRRALASAPPASGAQQ